MEDEPQEPKGFDWTPILILNVVFMALVGAMIVGQPPLAGLIFLAGIVAEVVWLVWFVTK